MTYTKALEELFNAAPRAVFSQRNDAIPGDLRITWRLSVLCLILHRFRGKKSTLASLHTMWWAIRTKETRSLFLRWLDGNKRPDEIIVRFDPSLSMTVDLALGVGLVAVTVTGSIALSPAGISMASDLWTDNAVLVNEKQFISELPRSLTQTALKELIRWN